MNANLEKWLNELTKDSIKSNITNLNYFDEDFTCSIAIPYDIAADLLATTLANRKIPKYWLQDNTLWLKLDYHTDGLQTTFSIDIGSDIEELTDIPVSVKNLIEEAFREKIKEQ